MLDHNPVPQPMPAESLNLDPAAIAAADPNWELTQLYLPLVHAELTRGIHDFGSPMSYIKYTGDIIEREIAAGGVVEDVHAEIIKTINSVCDTLVIARDNLFTVKKSITIKSLQVVDRSFANALIEGIRGDMAMVAGQAKVAIDGVLDFYTHTPEEKLRTGMNTAESSEPHHQGNGAVHNEDQEQGKMPTGEIITRQVTPSDFGGSGESMYAKTYNQARNGKNHTFSESLIKKLEMISANLGQIIAMAEREFLNTELQRRPLNLPVFLSEVSSIFSIDCGIEISYDSKERMTLHADPVQLTEVVVNLLSNARKYGRKPEQERAKINITIVNTAESSTISIRDHGNGIPEDQLANIFNPEFRLPEHIAQGIEGTGNGLDIVMQIVKRHGGDITVESEPGEGACFHINIPHQALGDL